MARYSTFTFKCDQTERRMIATLAERLQRSRSDAIRFVIREAVRALSENADANGQTKPEQRRARQ